MLSPTRGGWRDIARAIANMSPGESNTWRPEDTARMDEVVAVLEGKNTNLEKWVRWHAPNRDDSTSKTAWHLFVDERQVCRVAGDRADSWVPEVAFTRPRRQVACRDCLAVMKSKRADGEQRQCECPDLVSYRVEGERLICNDCDGETVGGGSDRGAE